MESRHYLSVTESVVFLAWEKYGSTLYLSVCLEGGTKAFQLISGMNRWLFCSGFYVGRLKTIGKPDGSFVI